MSCMVDGSSSNAAAAAAAAACNDAGENSETKAAEYQRHALLPAPFATLAASGDVGAQITALLVCASREQKQEARDARQAADGALQKAEDQELSKMKDEADCKLASGLVSGAAQAASGALTVGSAGASEATAKTYEGAGKVAEGLGKLDAAWLDYYASDASKGAKQASQHAGHAKTAIDDARDLDKDAKELLNRALGYYKEYLTAKADTQRATLLKA